MNLQETLAALNVPPVPERPNGIALFALHRGDDAGRVAKYALALESALLLAVEAARVQERERCAKVAENVDMSWLEIDGTIQVTGHQRIAQEIRSLAAQPGVAP